MFGLRSKAKQLRKMFRFGRTAETETSEPLEGKALIAQTLFAREKAGQVTTLRQLHLITQISQPAALKLLADMERAGQVTVDEVIHDTFESTIELSQQTRKTLKSRRIDNAA